MKRFQDDLNTAVFTTKYVLEENSPILFVFHFLEDGVWQFSGPDNYLNDEDYRVVSLEEIINLDPSVLDVSDLELGSKAYRKAPDSPWKISWIDNEA